MDSENQVPRSAGGVQLGSDSTLQVQVFSTNVSAEYGRGSGGVMNSISRSGSDEFHGTFFEYFRNSKLDARNFFDPGPEPTPFKRNQFGLMLTGPVWKERTFFMASFEGLRDRLTDIDLDYFPDEFARQGIITDKDGKPLRTVEVDKRVQPYLKLYPPPNSIRLGGGIQENRAIVFLPTDENFFTVRIDHKISDRDSVFGRYTFDDATSRQGTTSYLFTTRNESRQQYLTLVGSHIFNLQALASFRFGFTRPVRAAESISDVEIPRRLFFVPSASQFGLLRIPGLSLVGPQVSTPQASITNTFQWANDFIVQKGAHALKSGVGIHRYRWATFNNAFKAAEWAFNSLESFLQAGPESTSLTVALPDSDNRKDFRQTLLGFYVQDSYRVSSALQWTLGLRYEFATLIHDAHDRDTFLPDPGRDSQMQIGRSLKKNPSLRGLSPRFAFAWAPWKGRSTLLGGGFGIFYDQLLEYAVEQRKGSPPFWKKVIRLNFNSRDPGSAFPNAIAAAANKPLTALVLDYDHFANPMILRYNFTLQQNFPAGWRAQASYVGARGNHLYRAYEVNQFPAPIQQEDGSLCFPPDVAQVQMSLANPSCPPVASVRAGPINPAFGSIDLLSSDAQSFYNSFQVSASKSAGRGISLQASYTYSKSVDDISHHNFGGAQYGLQRTLERGLSDFDIRHSLVLNYFLTLPSGNGQPWGKSAILSHLLGGWRLGGILTLRTGTPYPPLINVRTPGYLFAATRPNLLPGQNNNPTSGITAGCEGVPAGQKLGGPDLYFDPCVFGVPPAGTLGNLGRNTLISPSLFNMDVSLQRDFLLDAKRRLQFRMEIFNLPNHANFNRNLGTLATVFVGASGRRNPGAGRFHQTITTARQIQFALRLSF